MKKSQYFILVMLILLAGCHKEEPTIPEEKTEKSKYTIMVYGCCGGDLDAGLMQNISQCLSYGATDSVKVVWQFNMSKSMQKDKDGNPHIFSGTTRVIIPKGNHELNATYDGNKPEYVYKAIEELTSMKDISFEKVDKDGGLVEMFNPDELTSFIDWTTEKCPADNYMLILWGHGNGWNYDDDMTKAVIFDDNFKYDDYQSQGLSLDGCIAAVEASKQPRLKCIYNDACLMCTMENYYGYSNIADFAIGSSSPAAAEGGDYFILLSLINGLQSYNDNNFYKVMSAYCDHIVQYWGPNAYSSDISITNLKELDTYGEYVKTLSEYLVKNYETNKEAINDVLRRTLAIFAYKYPDGSIKFNPPLIDVNTFIDTLSNKMEDYDLMGLSLYAHMELNKIKHTAVSNLMASSNHSISISITLMDKTEFERISGKYCKLDVDSKTDWSSWLKINEQPLTKDNPTISLVSTSY